MIVVPLLIASVWQFSDKLYDNTVGSFLKVFALKFFLCALLAFVLGGVAISVGIVPEPSASKSYHRYFPTDDDEREPFEGYRSDHRGR
ncbi:MAG: hypothetical protein EKK49_19655 [Rhodocyclaceae bacterium]|nr:MAG: hypothetical protein EKK49_19655 [Rhodocyclaceae bacterium]